MTALFFKLRRGILGQINGTHYFIPIKGVDGWIVIYTD